MKKYLLLTGVACLFTAQANAEGIKPYIGMDLGASRIEYNNKVNKLLGESHSEAFLIANLNLGVKFNQYFGLEVSSQGSSEVDLKAHGYKIGDLSYSSVGLDAVGYIPLNTKLDLFAIAGVGHYSFDIKAGKYDKWEVHEILNKTAFRAGLGTQYNINDKWSIRGMFRYHHIDNDYIDYIGEATVGVRYNF